MNDDQIYSHLKDLVDEQLDFKLTNDDKYFMKKHKENVIRKIVHAKKCKSHIIKTRNIYSSKSVTSTIATRF